MNYNKAVVIGNITKDPELKQTPSGLLVCSFSVATNRVKFDKSTNEKKQEVEYHNIVAWEKTAELVHQYMRKGSQILVEGRLQTRTWDGKDGRKNYRTEIVAENIQFGARPAGQEDRPAARPQQQIFQHEAAPSDDFEASLQVPPVEADTEQEINVEDIPF